MWAQGVLNGAAMAFTDKYARVANYPEANIAIITAPYVLQQHALPRDVQPLDPGRGFPIPLLEAAEYRAKDTKPSSIQDVLNEGCFACLAQDSPFPLSALVLKRRGDIFASN